MLDEKNGTYYSGEQCGQCQICGKITDQRMGFCFSCADAQTIIATGSDMYDRTFNDYTKWAHEDGDGGPKLPADVANNRIKLLIKNGWSPPKEKG